MQEYDLVVIGSGPGGFTAAVRAASLGLRVAVAEKENIGGVYLNQGCIPIKALLHSAMLYDEMTHCSQFGLQADGVSMDFAGMKEYLKTVTTACRISIEKNFEKEHIPVYVGQACIHPAEGAEGNGHIVSVSENKTEKYRFRARNVLIATGARPASLQVGSIPLQGISTSRDILEGEWNFDSVLIVGGGIVGTEFAMLLCTMGIKVTVLERADFLLPGMGEEIGSHIREDMEQRGVEVHTGTHITGISRQRGGLLCSYTEMGVRREKQADKILVAVGRQACLDGVLDERLYGRLKLHNGAPVIKGDFQTSIPGIYAVGDVLQRTQLAHSAAAQATYMVDSLAGRQPTVMLSSVPAGMYVNLPIIPSCIYTRPEVASVGLTEAQARRAGCQTRCGVYHMEDNSQSIITGQRGGMIKLVFALPGRILIGAQMICPRATEMIAEMATAIANGLTAQKLMLAMRVNPTYSESIARAVENSGLL